MAKNNKYRLGQDVNFTFAGSEHRGVVVKIIDENKVSIQDSKYTYPVDVKNIIKKN